MSARLRTVVVFRTSAFNSSEPRAYFINDCCYGDDLARWLIARLRADGVQTDDEPGQEDFGWYFNYRCPGAQGAHCLVITSRPEDEGDDDATWICCVERDRGMLGTLVGARKRGIELSALQAVHRALAGVPGAGALAWHHESAFLRGDEGGGAPAPDA
jgi:hypothetical protein